MSTPAVTPEITINNTPAEILASHTAEKEAQAAPQATPQAAPTTPAPPVVEAPKPFEIVKGQDGSVEVKFNEGGQIFKGTMDEVLEKISESKLHANQRIKELSTKAPEVPATPQPTPAASVQAAWVPDETTSVNAINGMLTGNNFGDAVGIGLAQMFGTNDPTQVKAAISDLIQLSAELKGQKEISTFAQKATDFPWSEQNTAMIVDQLRALNLPVNADTMLFAHNALKGMGKYHAVPVAAAVAADTPNPAPPNGGSNPPSQTAEQEQARLMTIPLAQLEAEIRAGR